MDAKERAAEAKRVEALQKELKGMSTGQLEARAQSAGVDTSKMTNRDQVEAAIEKAEHDAIGKKRLEAMHRAEEDAGRNTKEPSEDAKAVHRVNNEFCREIPEAGRAGSYVPGDDDGSAFAGDYDVADGTYRVVGSDWLFVFKGKKLDRAMLATAANKYGGKDVIEV